jgi:hypothetical protein
LVASASPRLSSVSAQKGKPAEHLQPLAVQPGLAGFNVFVKFRNFWVPPPTVAVAHNIDRANLIFFGHDFVLAAIAADFEGVGTRFSATGEFQ